MKKRELTIKGLIRCAKEFCQIEHQKYYQEYFGVTDGKAIGTIVEHKFQEYLTSKYDIELGNSANGLDLPTLNTDIKVTSVRQPQSSCPYQSSKQKIYGLGYNLIVFVYQKTDNIFNKKGALDFVSCSFIQADRTADYQTTTGLLSIIKNNGNEDDIFAFLVDHKIPADEVTLHTMAKQILQNPPKVGYLTISNALQWRLQYGRVVALEKRIAGITSIITYNK